LLATKELAVAFARELELKLRRYGSDVLAFDPKEWARWLWFRGEIGEGVRVEEVLGVWREHLVVRAKARMSLGMGIGVHVDALELAGVDGGHLAHVKLHLSRLADFFGREVGVIEVGADGLREWLSVLGDEGGRNGEGLGVEAIRHHLKSARAFFSRAVAEGWVFASPADPRLVKAPRGDRGEKLALSIEDAQRLLRLNRDFPVCGKLACEMFAGVRCSGAVRLAREDVNWDDECLLLPDAKHKTGRFVLDGLPGNFWAWLRHADGLPGFWEMTPRQYLDRKAEAFERAGVTNTGNILRRSFCSWMIAIDGDASRVAAMMQHSSQATLHRQYRTSRTSSGFVTRKRAQEWLQIFP
jgi:integrase